MADFKIQKPVGAPGWFKPGIVCDVENQKGQRYKNVTIIWYNQDSPTPFYAIDGISWVVAVPVKKWVPSKGELVMSYSKENDSWMMGKYEKKAGKVYISSQEHEKVTYVIKPSSLATMGMGIKDILELTEYIEV